MTEREVKDLVARREKCRAAVIAAARVFRDGDGEREEAHGLDTAVDALRAVESKLERIARVPPQERYPDPICVELFSKAHDTPPESRHFRALCLRADGKSQPEIGRILGVKPASVGVFVRKAFWRIAMVYWEGRVRDAWADGPASRSPTPTRDEMKTAIAKHLAATTGAASRT